MRYYSTQRPVMPGSYPKPEDNNVFDVANFGNRVYVLQIGRMAWGYIEYQKPLTDKEAADYELVYELTCSGCVNEAKDRSMDCCWDCNRNPRRARQDLYQPTY